MEYILCSLQLVSHHLVTAKSVTRQYNNNLSIARHLFVRAMSDYGLQHMTQVLTRSPSGGGPWRRPHPLIVPPIARGL